MESQWASLPIDLVGVIAGYTGKLRRRGDSFVTQIDIWSPKYTKLREFVRGRQKLPIDLPFTDIPFSDMLGVFHSSTFYSYGSASYCRRGAEVWFKISEPWYICAKDHYYFHRLAAVVQGQ
jgi:hypothetical protein